MNKKLLISILAAVIAGAAAFLVINNDSPMQDNASQNQTPASGQQTDTTPSPAGSGTYRDYSEAAVAASTGTRLLFFHAPWCPQCRALETSIKSGTIPGNVTIFKVDYDSNQELRQKYGVTIQTTIVRLDEAGNAAEKYVAYDDPTLQNVLTNAL